MLVETLQKLTLIYWWALIFFTSISPFVPFLRFWALHGKVLAFSTSSAVALKHLRHEKLAVFRERQRTYNPFVSHLLNACEEIISFLSSDACYVSKQRFIHFYCIGIFSTLALFLYIISSLRQYVQLYESRINVACILFLYFIHTLRRFFEQWFLFENCIIKDISVPARHYVPVSATSPTIIKTSLKNKDKHCNSCMHLSAYLVGISFYMFVPLSLFLDCETNNTMFGARNTLPIILLFLIFSSLMVLQFFSHLTLSKLRRYRRMSCSELCHSPSLIQATIEPEKEKNTLKLFASLSPNQNEKHSFENKTVLFHESQYDLPTGLLFDWITSPHYLIEILIYFFFFIVSRDVNVISRVFNVNFFKSQFSYFLNGCLMWYCCMFVSIGLTLNALNNYSFYVKKFRGTRKWRNQKALIPMLF